MIKAGIIGATGYAGGELVRLLMGHKEAEIKWYGSRSYIDKKYADVYRNMFEIVEDVCRDDSGCHFHSDAAGLFGIAAVGENLIAGQGDRPERGLPHQGCCRL